VKQLSPEQLAQLSKAELEQHAAYLRAYRDEFDQQVHGRDVTERVARAIATSPAEAQLYDEVARDIKENEETWKSAGYTGDWSLVYEGRVANAIAQVSVALDGGYPTLPGVQPSTPAGPIRPSEQVAGADDFPMSADPPKPSTPMQAPSLSPSPPTSDYGGPDDIDAMTAKDRAEEMTAKDRAEERYSPPFYKIRRAGSVDDDDDDDDDEDLPRGCFPLRTSAVVVGVGVLALAGLGVGLGLALTGGSPPSTTTESPGQATPTAVANSSSQPCPGVTTGQPMIKFAQSTNDLTVTLACPGATGTHTFVLKFSGTKVTGLPATETRTVPQSGATQTIPDTFGCGSRISASVATVDGKSFRYTPYANFSTSAVCSNA
jgi:hypothetical protein